MLKILLFLSFFALSGLGVAVLAYGVGAWVWMLDDDVEFRIDFEVEEAFSLKTIGLIRAEVDYALQSCCGDSSFLSINPVFSGKYSRAFRVRPTDSLVKGSYRTELRLRPHSVERDVWYRAHVYVPDNWRFSQVKQRRSN